jgi:putative oxidoreductase
MKKLFRTSQDQTAVDIWLLVFRVCIACFMLTHGVQKLNHLFSGDEIKFLNFLGIGSTASFALSTFAEFLCSIFVLIGFATRFAAIPLIINMSVAVLMAHSQDPFKIKELALIYLLIFITFLIFGGGKYSIDHFLFRGNKKTGS